LSRQASGAAADVSIHDVPCACAAKTAVSQAAPQPPAGHSTPARPGDAPKRSALGRRVRGIAPCNVPAWPL